MYLVHSDPEGEREFAYARSGSVGSSLSADDLDLDVLAAAGAVVASGITCAISRVGGRGGPDGGRRRRRGSSTTPTSGRG